MEKTIEELATDLEKLDENINLLLKNGISEYENIPARFADRLPGKKEELIKEARTELTSRIKDRLDFFKEEISNLVDEGDRSALCSFHQGRRSWDSGRRTAAETAYQSAMSLLNTKNENMILNEFKRSVIDDERHEFTYTILENFLSIGLSREAEDKIIELAKKNEKINQYLEYLRIGKSAEEIINKIDGQKSHLLMGQINKNYAINKNIRDKIKELRGEQ